MSEEIAHYLEAQRIAGQPPKILETMRKILEEYAANGTVPLENWKSVVVREFLRWRVP